MTSMQPNPLDVLPSPEDMTLLEVQVFFRHGARTPLRFLEGIKGVLYDKTIHGAAVPHAEVPYKVIDLDTGGERPYSKLDEMGQSREFKGGMNAGVLTATGKEQMYQLGRRLRQRYIHELGFISEKISKEDVYVRSSNLNRTLESLQCVVGGMFGVEQFMENGPLVIPVRSYLFEDLAPNVKNCKALQQVGEGMVESLLKNAQYKDVLTKVQHIIGTDNYIDMVMLYDHMVTRKVHGLVLEDWMTKLEDEIAKAAISGVHYYIAGAKEHWQVMRPLTIGRVYQIIEDNMKAAIKKDSSTQKLHLYSCHDTTIFPLMMVLGDPMDHWPPYSADIRYELYEDNNRKHWVNIMFCGENYKPAGFDSSLIEFSRFQEIIKHIKLTPEEYKHMCSDINTANEFVKNLSDQKWEFKK